MPIYNPPNLSGYVPYVGATQDVNLGPHTLFTAGLINSDGSTTVDPVNSFLTNTSIGNMLGWASDGILQIMGQNSIVRNNGFGNRFLSDDATNYFDDSGFFGNGAGLTGVNPFPVTINPSVDLVYNQNFYASLSMDASENLYLLGFDSGSFFPSGNTIGFTNDGHILLNGQTHIQGSIELDGSNNINGANQITTYTLTAGNIGNANSGVVFDDTTGYYFNSNPISLEHINDSFGNSIFDMSAGDGTVLISPNSGDVKIGNGSWNGLYFYDVAVGNYTDPIFLSDTALNMPFDVVSNSLITNGDVTAVGNIGGGSLFLNHLETSTFNAPFLNDERWVTASPTSSVAAGFGMYSKQSLQTVNSFLPVATDATTLTNSNQATYATRRVFSLIDHAATREALRMEANGSASAIGFLGASAVVRQTGGSATAGALYTGTEQAMLQKAYDALRTFGLLT